MNVMESAAKEKWCPFTRVGGEEASVNRYYKSTLVSSCLCIGSDCMMWIFDNPDAVCEDGEDHGYCGLAGKHARVG